jgi:trk system potassium uptake protein
MFLEIIKAILMGIVEGITEWLPISSTGHMILLPENFLYAGKAIMDIPIPGDTILISITRDTEFIIPHGRTILLPWDHILCLTRDDSLHELTEAWGLSDK